MFQVGDKQVYPSLLDWERVAVVPEAAARAWVLATCPDVEPSGYCNITARDLWADEKGNFYQYHNWLNKLLIVVGTAHLQRDVAMAIFAYDGEYWLLREKKGR